MSDKPLTPLEEEAVLWLQRESSILITQIPDKTETGAVFGDRTPGRATFRRLEKAGLCYQTEEDPMFPEDGPDSPTWTPTIDLTDLGRAWCVTPVGASVPTATIARVPSPAPSIKLGVVTHVGSLDPSRKGEAGSSYEGLGLSFSSCPEAWEEIAELSGPWWDTDLSGKNIIDGLTFLKSSTLMDNIHVWALINGLATSANIFKAIWRDTEIDELVEVWCSTEKQALAEIEDQDEASVEPSTQWAPTKALCIRMGNDVSQVGKPTPNTASELMMAWAEDHGWDGAWWNENLDPAAYSAPRGVIFPSHVADVTWTVRAAPATKPKRRRSP